MPWKLIFFFVAATIVLVFIAFNVGSQASVSFIFVRTPETPVFLIILVSFLLGMASLLPMVIKYRPRKAGKAGPDVHAEDQAGKTDAGQAQAQGSAQETAHPAVPKEPADGGTGKGGGQKEGTSESGAAKPALAGLGRFLGRKRKD